MSEPESMETIARDILISWRSLARGQTWDAAAGRRLRDMGDRFEERIDQAARAAEQKEGVVEKDEITSRIHAALIDLPGVKDATHADSCEKAATSVWCYLKEAGLVERGKEQGNG